MKTEREAVEKAKKAEREAAENIERQITAQNQERARMRAEQRRGTQAALPEPMVQPELQPEEAVEHKLNRRGRKNRAKEAPTLGLERKREVEAQKEHDAAFIREAGTAMHPGPDDGNFLATVVVEKAEKPKKTKKERKDNREARGVVNQLFFEER